MTDIRAVGRLPRHWIAMVHIQHVCVCVCVCVWTSAFIERAQTFENLSPSCQHLPPWVKRETRPQWTGRRRRRHQEPMTCCFGSVSLRKCQRSFHRRFPDRQMSFWQDHSWDVGMVGCSLPCISKLHSSECNFCCAAPLAPEVRAESIHSFRFK